MAACKIVELRSEENLTRRAKDKKQYLGGYIPENKNYIFETFHSKSGPLCIPNDMMSKIYCFQWQQNPHILLTISYANLSVVVGISKPKTIPTTALYSINFF